MSTPNHSKTPINSPKTDGRRWIDSQKKHVDWIINIHWVLLIVLAIELLFDLCKFLYINKYIYNVNSNLRALGKVIDFFQNLPIFHVSEMRSALLVVWTFLTVIVMYFAEHESNRIYGQTVADLAVSVLDNRTNKLLRFALLELVILLLSTMFTIPLTLSILFVTVPLTTYYAIYFILHDASSVNLLLLFEKLLRKDIHDDWIAWNNSSSNSSTQTVHWRFLRRFSSMIENMDLGLSNDYEFVLSIMPHLLYYMMDIKDDTETQSSILSKSIQWDIPYETVKIVMRGVPESQRIKLGHDMMRVFLHPENDVTFTNSAAVVEVLAVISLYPIIYAEDSRNPIQEFNELLHVVKDQSMRTKIILRAIMNNLYLEVSPNTRSLITLQLTQLLPDYDEQNLIIYEEALHYWWDISNKYSESMHDASHLSRYMNIYVY